MPKKLALKLGILTYQILTNDDEVCIPSLSSIILAVTTVLLSQLKLCQRVVLQESFFIANILQATLPVSSLVSA